MFRAGMIAVIAVFGKYVINHSFILPGLIGVGTSCLIGYLIASARGMV